MVLHTKYQIVACNPVSIRKQIFKYATNFHFIIKHKMAQ